MGKIGRPGLPSDNRQQVWEIWKVGDSMSVIAETVGSQAGSIFSILLPFGGIYQAPQRRRATALSVSDREEISRGVAADESYRAIGRRLGRPTSTISRAVHRRSLDEGRGIARMSCAGGAFARRSRSRRGSGRATWSTGRFARTTRISSG